MRECAGQNSDILQDAAFISLKAKEFCAVVEASLDFAEVPEYLTVQGRFQTYFFKVIEFSTGLLNTNPPTFLNC